ncbi:hypothetical protein CXF59_09425 [Flavobacterium sp. ALD4]|nr:hypothetical protein CXF59_09425 [Flavobacterium sp. ALD4]
MILLILFRLKVNLKIECAEAKISDDLVFAGKVNFQSLFKHNKRVNIAIDSFFCVKDSNGNSFTRVFGVKDCRD